MSHTMTVRPTLSRCGIALRVLMSTPDDDFGWIDLVVSPHRERDASRLDPDGLVPRVV